MSGVDRLDPYSPGSVAGEVVAGRAEVLPASDLEHVQELIARKYRLDRVLILPVYNLVQRLHGKRPSGAAVALAITSSPTPQLRP